MTIPVYALMFLCLVAVAWALGILLSALRKQALEWVDTDLGCTVCGSFDHNRSNCPTQRRH